ncbi:MAG TPA: hypothetical protein VKT77_03540 [Chthonomonadaceae bacterium]|nr:hypothetical protein [Chthonomonadaceae bacterium]
MKVRIRLIAAVVLAVLLGSFGCGSGSISTTRVCLGCGGLSGEALLNCKISQPPGCPN